MGTATSRLVAEIDPHLSLLLTDYARATGNTRKAVVEAALVEYLAKRDFNMAPRGKGKTA